MVCVLPSYMLPLLTACAVAASVILTQWRTRIRREMNERDVVCVVLCSNILFAYHRRRSPVVFTLIVFLTTKQSNTSVVRSMKPTDMPMRYASTKPSSIKSSVR